MMMFVTVWLGILDLATGRLTCANAGHEYPVLRHKGGAFQIVTDHHDVMMGVIENAEYQEYTLDLEPGSTLFLYTDGLTDRIFVLSSYLLPSSVSQISSPSVLNKCSGSTGFVRCAFIPNCSDL